MSERRRRLPLVPVLLGGAVAGLFVLLVAIPATVIHRDDLPLERWYSSAVIAMVVGLQSGNAANPVAADDPDAIRAGRIVFTGSCAMCHGARGDGSGSFGLASYPRA